MKEIILTPKFKSLFLLMIMCATPLFGEWTKSVNINTGYDNNAFRNYRALSDYVFQLSGYISHSRQGENWRFRLYYRGNLSLFKNYDNRNFHYHRLGSVWSQDIGKNGSLLNLGVNGSIRKNRIYYNYYDFKEVSGYANIKIKFGPSISTVIGYKIRGRWY